MALKKIVGFEAGTLTTSIELASGSGSSGIVQTSIVHTGTYALRHALSGSGAGASSYAAHAIGAHAILNLATAYYRFYFYIATLPAANNEEFALIANGTTTYKMSLRITSAGKIQAYDSAGSQLGSDGATTLVTGNWYKIEIKCGTGSPAAYEIKINGSVELSGTGNLHANNNDRIWLGKLTNRNGQTVDFYYDDLAIDDAAYPADGGVVCLKPNGDGTYTTWTIGAGAGDDWTNVEEIPYDGDATYLVSASVGDASTFNLESTATGGISGTINAVKELALVAKNVPQASNVILRIRSGSTNSDTAGTGFTNSPAYAALGYLLAIDPATSLAWDTDALDAVEVGVVMNDVDDARLTACYLMVDFLPAAGGGARSYGIIF